VRVERKPDPVSVQCGARYLAICSAFRKLHRHRRLHARAFLIACRECVSAAIRVSECVSRRRQCARCLSSATILYSLAATRSAADERRSVVELMVEQIQNQDGVVNRRHGSRPCHRLDGVKVKRTRESQNTVNVFVDGQLATATVGKSIVFRIYTPHEASRSNSPYLQKPNNANTTLLSFFYRSSDAWNYLPSNLRRAPSTSAF
jgi:hypothetical protein